MKLVIETDELVKVAKTASLEGAKLTIARVQKLVMSSPSLVDVVGASAIEDDAVVPVREQALDFLTERNESWFTTAEVRETCDLVSRSQVLKVLKELRDEGRIVSRNAAGRNWEWKAA